jgi:hypothetical protein
LSKAFASALPPLIATPDGLVNAGVTDVAGFVADALDAAALELDLAAADEAKADEAAADDLAALAAADEAAATLLDFAADDGVIEVVVGWAVVLGLAEDEATAAADDLAAALEATAAALEAAAEDFAAEAEACA